MYLTIIWDYTMKMWTAPHTHIDNLCLMIGMGKLHCGHDICMPFTINGDLSRDNTIGFNITTYLGTHFYIITASPQYMATSSGT